MTVTRIVFAAPWDAERLFSPIARLIDADYDAVYVEMQAADPANLDGWSFDAEIAALEYSLLKAGGEVRAHLVAYSGAAAVGIGALADRPDIAASSTLIEPPWIGNDEWSAAELEFRAAFAELPDADSADAWSVICSALNAQDTPIPPPPAMPPEMLKAGFVHIWNAYMHQTLDRERLRGIEAPVLLPVGSGSTSRMADQAELLCELIPNARSLEVEGSAHFDLPLTGAAAISGAISAQIATTVAA